MNHELEFYVESLESRKMLAGNVDVVVTGDNSLVITGDDLENKITVIDGQGDIFVLGLDGTIVANGGTTGLALTDLNKLTITMKGGDDSVVVATDVRAQGRVRMTGAAGNDHLSFHGTAQDRVQIIGGGGFDFLFVTGTFNDKVTLNGGSGDDAIGCFSGTFHDTVTLNGGSGDDAIDASGTFNDKVTLNGGAGRDTLNISVATFATDVKANMGHGPDTVRLTAGVSFADARFNFGSGDDLLVMVGTVTGELLFNGGGGFDTSNPNPNTIAQIYPNVTLKSFEGAA